MDGAVVFQMLKQGRRERLMNMLSKYLSPILKYNFEMCLALILCGTGTSLKCSVRTKRGKGIRRRVIGSPASPGNWHNFSMVDENKEELFQPELMSPL